MIKKANGLTTFLSENLEVLKKCQNEIAKKKNENIKFQNEFKEGLEYYENCLKEKKEIPNEEKDKILKIIIMTLSIEKMNKIIEISLEAIEEIISKNYLSKEIIEKNLNNISKKIIFIYNNYNENIKIMMKLINLVKEIIEIENINLKNESFYNIITFLILNYMQINSFEDKISIDQIRKESKILLNKCLERLIAKKQKNICGFENLNICKYYMPYYLNNRLFGNYINLLIQYNIDKILENSLNNKNIKNEKGSEKGKFNWCFNCRNKANYYSDDLSLPICSKNCENKIKYMEKILNMKIYYNNDNYSVFEDYINTIKIIAFYAFYYLEFYLFNYNIYAKKKINNIDDNFYYISEIIYILLSQFIIIENMHNKYILDMIKEDIFPLLIEISLFNKKENNINGFKNNLKLFQLLLTKLDDWYKENLKIEIYTFTKAIIYPFFSKELYNDDSLVDSNEYVTNLEIKYYLIDFLNFNLIDFLFELNINYDCQFYFDSMFINIIKNITKNLYDSYDGKFNEETDYTIELMNKINNSSWILIKNIIIRIDQFSIELNIKDNKDNKNIICNNIINDSIKLKNIVDELVEIFCTNQLSKIKNYLIKKEIMPQDKDFIKYKETFIKEINNLTENKAIYQKDTNKEKRFKLNLPFFPLLIKNKNNTFEENDIKNLFYDFFCQNFNSLITLNYDDFTAYIFSCFLKLKFEEIMANNKLIISNFFSSSTSFSIKALNQYINSFNLKNYNILEALHLLFNYLPFINKQQIIEEIISIFSKKYIKDNFMIEEEFRNYNLINEYFKKLSHMIIEISNSFSKENNTELKKINDYLHVFRKDFENYKDEENLQIINNSYIYDIYNLTLQYPLNLFTYPNSNSLIDTNGIIKSSNNLYGTFPTEIIKMKIIDNINVDNIFISTKK